MQDKEDIVPVDDSNSIFKKAAAFVNDTEEHIFLTGRAGTGKTTFLKYIRANTQKQCAIVAPTGVAAINAGGETIHSFLQLPFGPFVPGSMGGFGRQGDGTQDKHSLLANLRLRETKLKLLRKLELLIIDEVSMVRCDMVDSIDLVLRHVRKNWTQPFGGVQVLFIGDLYQLPPVVKEEEWYILRNYYASPYFFSAKVLEQNPPIYIELKKIYRQKEQDFIEILNRVRNGEVMQRDIDALNDRYNPEQQKEKGYIILCTHNHLADEINQQALEGINEPVYKYDSSVTGEFNPKSLPAEEVLQLKKGAQVMFLKNDLQTPRRYYNGKIAIVDKVTADNVFVTFPGSPTDEPIKVEKETWKNMRYTLNQQTGQIEEEESGSFTQYPLRLAWAITVHKSQGLTLDKVVVDLNQSFAPGQVYVALSRCTSMGGLVLRSRLHINNVMTDSRVVEFARSENEEDELDALLTDATRLGMASKLCRIFSFLDLLAYMEQLAPELEKRKTGPRQQNLDLAEKVTTALKQAQVHAIGFQRQIITITQQNDDALLHERKRAGANYFLMQVLMPMTMQVDAHIKLLDDFPKIAKQTKAFTMLKDQLQQKTKELALLIT